MRNFLSLTWAGLRKKNLIKSALSNLLAVVIVFCLASPAIATGLFDLPNFDADQVWVVDTADAISNANQSKLTKTFKEFANETGQEIRMVAVRRLDYGETVESLAAEIFADWYPDAAAQANQTLLVLDTLTNNVAIRSGDAAQELIGAEVATSIVEDTVGYNIRKGNKYNQAFIEAGDRLIAVLAGEEDPGPPVIEDEIQIEGTFTKAEDTDQGSATVWVIGFLIVATVVPMVTYYWYVGFGG
ncbi:MAG: TPM domain-containing protein [Cyanobacteria bacterium P01_C01_bin.72]